MTDEIFIKYIRKDIKEAFTTPGISQSDVHKILRLNLEKLLMYDRKRFEKTCLQYDIVESRLLEQIATMEKEIINLNEQLIDNDKKIYDAIEKL